MTAEDLLVETVARHFEDVKIDGTTVDLGFMRITCRLGTVRPWSGSYAVQLLFDVDGGGLRGPIELSTTGYGATREAALVGAACGWSCSFGPVFRAALSDDVVDGVASFELIQNGVPYRVYVDAYDYVLYFSEAGGEQPAEARKRFALPPWLAFHVLGSGGIELDGARTQVLSIYVGELPDRRIVEIGFDGVKQGGFDELVAAAPKAAAPQMVSLREVAIVVPD
jgi:hypothetical protein